MSDMKKDLISTIKIGACYLLIFLVGKFWVNKPCPPFLVHLFHTDPTLHPYLYGWLIMHGRMLYFVLISLAPVPYGKSRFGWTTLSAFALGLPLGEFLGYTTVNWTHYGWAIFILTFASGCLMGIVLEKFPKEKVSLRAKAFWLWLAVYAALILGSILWVRSQFPTSG